MDPDNRMEAIREAETDVNEGADFLIVKPALTYLQTIRDDASNFNLPLVAHNVSGEYAMANAAAINGRVDGNAVAMDEMRSSKRAGANLIFTYQAKDIARWINNK